MVGACQSLSMYSKVISLFKFTKNKTQIVLLHQIDYYGKKKKQWLNFCTQLNDSKYSY